MRSPLRSTPIKFLSVYRRARADVYSPLPHPSSRVRGFILLKKTFQCPAIPSGYCRTLGKDRIASNRNNFFFAMAIKIKDYFLRLDFKGGIPDASNWDKKISLQIC